EAPEGDGQIFEGAAVDDSVLVDLTVLHAEGAFDELRAHAQQAGHDHPERRTRTAEGDGDADTGDVAESDGPRQGRGQGLEVGDLPRVVLRGELPADDLKRQLGPTGLDEAEVDGEDQYGEDQPHDDEREGRFPEGDQEEDDVAAPRCDLVETGVEGNVDRGVRFCMELNAVYGLRLLLRHRSH